ncbi:ABC transporter substrate-binding protein [Paenibacillus ginsengarvi]|uniref:Extracellular solute-binding protein n=1 Tax=Paenibacillus ginsengarvi TaxID=400777 RepID=A0A3B0CZN1_9BACL|nr:extracellular solute-binding protein [Paenibacillus ginsengarvi]RKN86916.1 extracellular solute-binding protein [Paenibacillus ginsengarvi]
MFRHKYWLLLAAAVCFAIILISGLFSGTGRHSKPNAGEGSLADEPIPEAGAIQKRLRMAVSMQSKEFALLQQLKEQYQTAHPGIEVVLENMPDETVYAKLKKAAQLGEAPDVMLLDNNWLSEFAALGYLLPVDSMLTTGLQAEQMEQALAQVKWNGYLWGVPKNLDAYVVVYNAKRLNELGEKPPATTEELIALHKQTHRPDEGKYGVYFDAPDGRSFLSLVRMLGGAKTISKTSPAELSDPAVLKSLESFLFPLSDSGKDDGKTLSRSFPQEGATWKPWEQLNQGKLVGYITKFSDWKMNDSAAVVMDKMPLPKDEAIWKGPWLTGNSFAISAKSESGKEAFELIRDLASTGALLKFWNAGGGLPAQASMYPAIKNDAAFKTVAGYIDMDDALPAAPQRAKQMTVLQTLLESLWRGEVSFKTFMDRTTTEWNAIRTAAAK